MARATVTGAKRIRVVCRGAREKKKCIAVTHNHTTRYEVGCMTASLGGVLADGNYGAPASPLPLSHPS